MAFHLAFAQESKNITYLDNWQDPSLLSNSSKVRYNDVWGYTQNNEEFAFIGTTEGIQAFSIDLHSGKLTPIDSIQGKFVNAGVVHRDLKTYGHYLYTVCDEGISSLQVIDLQYLPDSLHLANEIEGTFGRVHNLFIDSANALLYACSVTPEVGGSLQSLIPMQVYNLNDPLNPVLEYEGPNDIPEVHDAYVRNNIAYLNCGFDGLRVYDFSTPSSPIFIQNLTFYQDQGYNHQGWMSPDGNVYVFGDETNGKRLKKCSVKNDHTLTNLKQFGSNWEEGSVAHNIMMDNSFAYVAYYNEGLRVFDIRSTLPKEVAFYDTYPDDSPFKMFGAWGVYTELPSGKILVSDRNYGLFVLEFDRHVFELRMDEFTIYPNPVLAGETLTIRMEEEINDFDVQLIDLNGKILSSTSYKDQNYGLLHLDQVSRGLYQMQITFENYLGETEVRKGKLIVH